MATDFGSDLIESLNQAVAHAKGQSKASQVHVLHVPNVRTLRESLKMSQQTFASAFRIPLATLKVGSREGVSLMRPPLPTLVSSKRCREKYKQRSRRSVLQRKHRN